MTVDFANKTRFRKDIAFEFASWVSVEFKLYLIVEFQRLKDDENDRRQLGWNLQRTLAKINYRIHTDAIKETLRPGGGIPALGLHRSKGIPRKRLRHE